MSPGTAGFPVGTSARPRLTLAAGACCALSCLALVSMFALQPLPDVLPSGLLKLYVVATGFSWAENLVCVLDPGRASGASLFVTDSQRGDVLRVDWVRAERARSGHYAQPILHPASADFSLMAGIAWNKRTGQLFVLANVRPSEPEPSEPEPFAIMTGLLSPGLRTRREHCVILELDAFAEPPAAAADTYTVVAHLERKCLGDGLAVHEKSGFLYVASQGDFLPRNGVVFEVDPVSGSVRPIITNAFSTDGAFIDQEAGLLYVTESLSPSHSVLVYSFAQRKVIKRIYPRGVSALDDFTLTADGHAILAADFLGSSGVGFSTGTGAMKESGRRTWTHRGRSRTELAWRLVSGVAVPTSIRRGCSPDPTSGFNEELLFITEGGGLAGLSDDRRVLAFAPPRGGFQLIAGETSAREKRSDLALAISGLSHAADGVTASRRFQTGGGDDEPAAYKYS